MGQIREVLTAEQQAKFDAAMAQKDEGVKPGEVKPMDVKPATVDLHKPHAFLTFLSIATAFGEPPAEKDPDILLSAETGNAVYDLMVRLVGKSPSSVAEKNPIGILDHMASENDVILCPLIYGYVNYAAPKSAKE